MHKIVFIHLLFALLSLSQAFADEMKFYFDGKEVTITAYGPDKLWVSPECADHPKKPCQALLVLPKADAKNLDLSGGINPGAQICRRLAGSVIIGRNADRNEQSFCQFKDHSLISTGALFKSALKN